jgi:lipoprotein Spr/probable lipoprotein NlpC
MLGAPHQVKTKNPPLAKIFFVFPLIALACSLSACSRFKSASIEKQGLSAEDRAFYSTYSKKFGIRFTGTENKQLIKAIDAWMGVPYQLGGCSKNGIDCSCFVQSVYADVYGIALRRSSNEMFGDVRTVAAKDLKEGDLLFLSKPGKKISHVGIYLKDKKFAHVTTARGVVISSLQEDYYQKYFHAGGRVAANW